MTPYVRRATLLSASAGSLGIVLYAVRSAFDLPEPLEIACYALFGPLLVLAFFGLAPLLSDGRRPLSAQVGTLFGIIGAAVNMCFAVVQLCNLAVLLPAIREATDPLIKADLRRVLTGVFTVQNGLNLTMDFFIDTAAFCWALSMWNHPRFGRLVALLSLPLVGTHYVLKAWTFPVPPREAGLFDAGPMVGIWFTIVSILTWRAALSSGEASAPLAPER